MHGILRETPPIANHQLSNPPSDAYLGIVSSSLIIDVSLLHATSNVAEHATWFHRPFSGSFGSISTS